MNNVSGLTEKQEIFCEEFLHTGRKKESALAAGYAAKSAAQTAGKLLKQAKILDYIHSLQKQSLKEQGINNDWAVLRAVDVYNRCMQAIPVTKWDRVEKCNVETGEYTFDSRGALKALEVIKELLVVEENDNEKSTTIINFIDDLGSDKVD